jgi:sugar lactone lactonase YvrE
MKNRIVKSLLVSTISLITISACTPDEVQPLLNQYDLKETSLYPEGIVYSSLTETTYVGSYYKGKIVALDLQGNMTDFVIDETLVAVVGMAIDEKNNTLWICNSDAGISLRSSNATIGQLAEVIGYDLTTGTKLKTIDVSGLYPGGYFLNDLVLDTDGNIYVTDSFSPVVYKIDTNGTPSVFATDPLFEVPPGAFGLNGIVFHPENYLIVGNSFGGILYKIPLNDPNNVQQINLSTSVNSLDGLLLTDNNTLALVSNNFTGAPFEEAVYNITTSDNWSSADVKSKFTNLEGGYPTTLTMINNGLFVNFGYFPELIDPNSSPNDSFKLQKITF